MGTFFRLVFTQPLIGNYGVPSSARDENGLLKYFESPVCVLGLSSSQVLPREVSGQTSRADALFNSYSCLMTGAVTLKKQC